MWFIYIVRCSDASLYTGITNDIDRRVREHNANNRVGSKYIKVRRPAELVYTETADSRSTALKREAQIKKLSRIAKETLITEKIVDTL